MKKTSNNTSVNATKPKPINKKAVIVRDLVLQGFKKTQISGFYVSKTGECYNVDSNKKLSIRNGKISIRNKAYNVAKIILATFAKIPVRNGRINFKNGNENDFSFNNLEYHSTLQQRPPIEADLIKCVRLYFQVETNFNTSSFSYKYYLNEIIFKRGFQYQYIGIDFDLFLDYFKNDFYTSNSQLAVSIKFGYSIRNAINAINKYSNVLVTDCLQDFENGILQIKDFAPPPPTKTQKLKALQKSINEIGLNVKIPLRKSSAKELLNRYKKQTNEQKKLL